MNTNLNVDTQALREKILDLAMRGKLVKQDAGDESATLNLNRARKEIEDAHAKKMLRQNKYVEAKKPAYFPKEWEAARLTELCLKEDSAIKRGPFGSAIKKSMFVPKSSEAFKVYEQGNAINKSVDYGNYFMPNSEFERLRGFEVKPGDIIISCAGTIGKYYVLPPNCPRGIINQALMKLTIDESIMCKEFFLLAFDHITDQLIANARGSAMKNLASLKYLKNEVVFPLPSLNEQRKIADKVSELFKQIDIIEKNVAEYQDLEQAMRSKLLDLAMRGKLVEQDQTDEPASELVKQIQAEKAELVKEGKIKRSKKLPEITDDEKPFDIPDSWEWVRLGDISSNIRYGFTASAQETGNAKLLRITDIQNGKVDWSKVPFCNISEEKENSLFLRPNDMLIARTGGTVGKSFVIQNVPEKAVFASYLIRVQLVDTSVVSFLEYFLLSPLYWKSIESKKTGTGQPNVNARKLSEIVLPLPPLAEQKRIVEQLSRLFERLETIKQNLTTVS